jgi:hypothetical protein
MTSDAKRLKSRPMQPTDGKFKQRWLRDCDCRIEPDVMQDAMSVQEEFSMVPQEIAPEPNPNVR